MARRERAELRSRQDIRRAEVLLGLARGLTTAESAEALQHRAAADRVSLHTAALAVLSVLPGDELAAPSGRHLSVVAGSSQGAVAEARNGSDERRHRDR